MVDPNSAPISHPSETPSDASSLHEEITQGISDVLEHLSEHLEALLFVLPGEVHPSKLASALQIPVSEVERGLEILGELFQNPDAKRGLRLQRYRGRYQLVTAPESSRFVERLLGYETPSRLSRAALETLAIVLYRQPVTRPQIEAIRGVNSDYVLRGLLIKGLVEESGRSEAPGRPILYSATADCLQYFGITSIADLPSLDLEES